ncbi:hypothetical protein MMC10_008638 [Thelotrema lepadinum]|nr:hypothetical protein [Thelotrema lepadinum]
MPFPATLLFLVFALFSIDHVNGSLLDRDSDGLYVRGVLPEPRRNPPTKVQAAASPPDEIFQALRPHPQRSDTATHGVLHCDPENIHVNLKGPGNNQRYFCPFQVQCHEGEVRKRYELTSSLALAACRRVCRCETGKG